MVDVFEQVEEELRSDRYSRLARTWLPVLAGVLLIALVAALAWWGWTSWETRKAERASVAYDRGLEQLRAGSAGPADAAFAEAADEGSAAYRVLALMQRSGIAVSTNRIPDALALLDEAAEASRDPLLRDPAALKAVYLAMDAETFEQVQARLAPLVAEGRPLRPFAQEAQAMLLIQHNRAAEARPILVQLTLGQDIPESLRSRAQAGLDAIDAGLAASVPAILAAQRATTPGQGGVRILSRPAPIVSAPAAPAPTTPAPQAPAAPSPAPAG